MWNPGYGIRPKPNKREQTPISLEEKSDWSGISLDAKNQGSKKLVSPGSKRGGRTGTIYTCKVRSPKDRR
jgi:hypothetical protein